MVAALVILARDVALVLGYRLLSPGGYDLEVTFLGKTATWVLYASLGFVLVTAEGTTWPIVLPVDRRRALPRRRRPVRAARVAAGAPARKGLSSPSTNLDGD